MRIEPQPETGGTGQQTWRIGELAKAAGVSVRALHHYDRLGLLRPSLRSGTGHRLYLASDVQRLHRILAIRGFGLSLTEVGRVLDGDVPNPRDLIRKQLRQAAEQIAVATTLQRRLHGVLDGLDNEQEPSAETLLGLMEVMNMNRQLTAAEFTEMSQQRQRWADSMTPEQYTEANAARNLATAELSQEQLEQMQGDRARLWPDHH